MLLTRDRVIAKKGPLVSVPLCQHHSLTSSGSCSAKAMTPSKCNLIQPNSVRPGTPETPSDEPRALWDPLPHQCTVLSIGLRAVAVSSSDISPLFFWFWVSGHCGHKLNPLLLCWWCGSRLLCHKDPNCALGTDLSKTTLCSISSKGGTSCYNPFSVS